VKPVKTKS